MSQPLTTHKQLAFAPREVFTDDTDLEGHARRKAPYTQRLCGDGQRRNITGGMAVRPDECDSWEAVDGDINHPFDVEDDLIAELDKARAAERGTKRNRKNAARARRRRAQRAVARTEQSIGPGVVIRRQAA